MPWTDPKSWTPGEAITDTDLNAQVRDNLRYLRGLDGPVYLLDDLILPDSGQLTLPDVALADSSIRQVGSLYLSNGRLLLQVTPPDAGDYAREIISDGNLISLGTGRAADPEITPAVGFADVTGVEESDDGFAIISTGSPATAGNSSIVWQAGQLVVGALGRPLIGLTLNVSAAPAGAQASLVLTAGGESVEGAGVAVVSGRDVTLPGVTIPESAADNAHAIIGLAVRVTRITAIDTTRRWAAKDGSVKGEERVNIAGWDLNGLIDARIRALVQAQQVVRVTRYVGANNGTVLKSGALNIAAGGAEGGAGMVQTASDFTAVYNGSMNVRFGVNPALTAVQVAAVYRDSPGTPQVRATRHTITLPWVIAQGYGSPRGDIHPRVNDNGGATFTVAEWRGDGERSFTFDPPAGISGVFNVRGNYTLAGRSGSQRLYNIVLLWDYRTTSRVLVTPARTYQAGIPSVWVRKNGVRFRRLSPPAGTAIGNPANNSIPVSANDVIQLEPVSTSGHSGVTLSYEYRANTVTS